MLLVRFSLGYLLLTGALGVAFYLAPHLAAYARTTHIHLGVVGFFLSMVMGVAYWMMPRPGGIRQEGAEALTFYLLNTGLLLRAISEPWWRYSGDPRLRVAVVTAGVLVLAAMVVFAAAMNRRVVTAETVRRMSRRRREQDQAR